MGQVARNWGFGISKDQTHEPWWRALADPPHAEDPTGRAVGSPKARLFYIARRRYGISIDKAEDLLQSALVTYLEVQARYPQTEEHPRILLGIFRNKCRQHLRAAGKLRALRSVAQSESAGVVTVQGSTTEDGVLDEIVQREDGRLILQALSRLRPKAREMFRLIAEEGLSRAELIRRFGLNKNTLDSRIHAYRRELRELLARRGVGT